MHEAAYLLYMLSFETDNAAYCEKWCNIFLLLRELPAVFVVLQIYPGTQVVLPLLWVRGLVFPETAVSSFISKAESVRKLRHLRLSSCVTVTFTTR